MVCNDLVSEKPQLIKYFEFRTRTPPLPMLCVPQGNQNGPNKKDDLNSPQQKMVNSVSNSLKRPGGRSDDISESNANERNYDKSLVLHHPKKVMKAKYELSVSETVQRLGLGTETSTKNGSTTEEDPVFPCPLSTDFNHRRQRCCINGFFLVHKGPFSEFESNCSCTTRCLIDLDTRVFWSNQSLRHEVKRTEVVINSLATASDMKRSPRARDANENSIVGGYPQPPDDSNRCPQRKNKQQTSRTQLNTSIYAEERLFICLNRGCGKAFTRNEELTRHAKIHSGLRPFICKECSKGFGRRDHLTKHQRTHLPIALKRIYMCPVPGCQHKYTRSDALTRHQWSFHQLRTTQPRTKTRL